MKWVLLMAPFLFSACAAAAPNASAPPAAKAVAQPAYIAPPPPLAPIFRSVTPVCQAFVRPSTSVKLEPMGEMRLSGRDDERSLSSGGFKFSAGYGEGAGFHEFGTSVYWEATGKQIEHSLYQLGDRAPTNLTSGHGATGLRYVYAPSGAELQYWCGFEDGPLITDPNRRLPRTGRSGPGR